MIRIQSVLIDNRIPKLKRIKILKMFGLEYDDEDITNKNARYRQINPNHFKKLWTFKLNDQIKFIVGNIKQH
jgi:hypothetical protein